jgi:hypothetical protein
MRKLNRAQADMFNHEVDSGESLQGDSQFAKSLSKIMRDKN